MEFLRIFPPLLVGATILLVQTQPAKAISSAEVAQIAQSITVKLENPDSRERGSGIIIKQDGDTYYVLTAFHVVRKPGKYTLLAPDAREYQINYQTVKKGADVDLAILQFTSSNTYKIAKIGNSDKSTLGSISYVAGFPLPTAAFPVSALRFLEGKITANASRPLDDGYTIVYSNHTLGGMSGGPVFNEQGEVIAVHGRAETVSDQDKENPKPVSTGNNLGIPINTFLRLAMVDVGVTSPAPVIAVAPKADDFYLQANDKYEKGNYQEAIENYTKAIEIDPQYTNAYNNRGIAYGNLGNYQQAISDYARAIALNPQDPDAYYNRGNAYDDLGEYQKAISDYDRAITLNPQDLEAYNNRGIAYRKLGDYQKAISDYNRAIALNPRSPNPYYNRGIAYTNVGEYQKAISDYDLAIALNPKSSNAYYNRGIAYGNLGEYQKAISDYDRAIALNPKSSNTYDNRGSAYGNLGEYQKALADFNQAIALNPKSANAYYNRGLVYRKLGNYQKAIADFTEAAKLYQEQGKTTDYQDALRSIRELQ
ncbi:tetratricopeptide repeat-containing S1 family peptidase [Merismopedia glauca]|uniref:Uncharacterized protein n=1 Tax=Merismopedia glauca CCAP 1448/3 TaxID=1296344 RepID=A0A2T1C8V0_9CYAN|nr:tetratricopeptide repeat-containing serine protease family protein [Merismopedia glauca]PSB04588.1 hypothetical protein C7B64_03285 [Merismopedia glauca CCAP 1448/3]